MSPPCLMYEDDHLLVVNKPPGLNTHGPSPFAGEGLYEWLRNREPRWANLAIIQRLDKETSGVIVFSKTALANRSLTTQFASRSVKKKYVLLTDRTVPKDPIEVRSALVRVGDKYVSRPIAAGADVAHTRFHILQSGHPHKAGPGTLVLAEPVTGRTHQIRVHATSMGFPILGDSRYGGTPAQRVCLHAAELVFQHPASGEQISFAAPADFIQDTALTLRRALINPQSTTAFRIIHGASDGCPGVYLDVFGSYLLTQNLEQTNSKYGDRLEQIAKAFSVTTKYEQNIVENPAARQRADLSPRLVAGTKVPDCFYAMENGLKFELSFAEGYSVGLFLDQRDNRRRLLSRHVAAGFPVLADGGDFEVLNAFAYTCGFSVCAAQAGARTTSLDLSKKYLEWGKRNFTANGIDPGGHDFIYGDAFDWLRRLARKNRKFDVILLDPPTFSRSKQSGLFRAEKDFGFLAKLALDLLRPGGVLFASCNTASWAPEAFLNTIRGAVPAAKRRIVNDYFCPQPPDFPVSRQEPAYLKSVWMRIQ